MDFTEDKKFEKHAKHCKHCTRNLNSPKNTNGHAFHVDLIY